jgi:UDP-GlcNAc:undecaprenyl-phosphate GlcNAc-1-phosphate transferase
MIEFLAAMLVTMLALPPLIRWGRAAQIVAVPDHRRLHAEVTPQIGGVGILLGFVAPSALLVPDYGHVTLFYVGVLVVFVVGLLDDYREVDYRLKFLAQFAAAGWIITTASLWDIGLVWGDDTVRLGLASSVVALFFMVGVTNAINLSDGLDGLAAGLALVSALALAVLGYQTNEQLPLTLMLALAGSLMGFLRFNSHPARVFMGDNGAYFIGFTLAFCCLWISCHGEGVSFFALLFALGLPVYDTLSVAVRRMAEGRGPFSPDRKHVHHRLLDGVGLTHDQVVLCMYVVHMVLVTTGFLLAEQNEILVGAVYGASLLALELALRALGRARLHATHVSKSKFLRARGWHRLLDVAAFAVMSTLMLWATLRVQRVSADFVSVAAAIFLLSSIVAIRRGFWTSAPGWVDRVALYVLGTYAVHFLASSGHGAVSQIVSSAGFLLLGAWLILKAVDAGDQSVRLTALDVLVVGAMIGISSLGPWRVEDYAVEVVKILVWFYAVELLCIRFRSVALVHALPFVGSGAILLRAAIG